MGINVLSLFDGISCGKVALERAGIAVDHYFSSEIDPNTIEISENNHKGITRLGDIQKHKEWDLPHIDLIIGGSPCQGFSRNGKHLNFEDPRSRLFFDYVDVLNEIREKNHDIKFLLENVGMKKEWLTVISERLGVSDIEINSRLLSAQYRQRHYWENWEVEKPTDQGIILKDILEDVDTTGYIEKQGILIDPSISEDEKSLVSVVNGEVRIRQAVKKGYIVAEDGDGVNLSFPTSKTRRGRVIKQKSPTIDCGCNVCVLRGGVLRKYTLTELERLQTLPDGYTKGVKEETAKKAIGNGWNVNTIVFQLKQAGL